MRVDRRDVRRDGDLEFRAVANRIADGATTSAAPTAKAPRPWRSMEMRMEFTFG